MHLYEKGLDEFPKNEIILENLTMVAWVALGVIAAWLFSPIAAMVYAAFAVLMVGVILRKLVCANCYYYGRWCHIGWGRLSSLLFRKGNVADFGRGIGMKLAPLTYALLTAIPLILLIISTVQRFMMSKLGLMALLLLVSAYGGGVGRKKGCSNCKMRLTCPGCAVKQKAG